MMDLTVYRKGPFEGPSCVGCGSEIDQDALRATAAFRALTSDDVLCSACEATRTLESEKASGRRKRRKPHGELRRILPARPTRARGLLRWLPFVGTVAVLFSFYAAWVWFFAHAG